MIIIIKVENGELTPRRGKMRERGKRERRRFSP